MYSVQYNIPVLVQVGWIPGLQVQDQELGCLQDPCLTQRLRNPELKDQK